jgi:hypothetical protein
MGEGWGGIGREAVRRRTHLFCATRRLPCLLPRAAQAQTGKWSAAGDQKVTGGELYRGDDRGRFCTSSVTPVLDAVEHDGKKRRDGGSPG